MTSVVAFPRATRFQACYEAVDAVAEFLQEVLLEHEIKKLNVPHGQTGDVARPLYDCFATNPQIIAALATVRDTEHCHVAVFVAAIRQMTAALH